MKFLCWDIDGTLLKTDKAGLYAFMQATTDVFKTSIDFKLIPTAGMTDCYIAGQIIRLITGHEPLPEETNNFLKRYEEILPMYLKTRQGQLMPSIHETLDYFQHSDGYISLLLTGNTANGAKAKLTRYDIIDYFDFSLSSFGNSCPDRLGLADQALKNIKNRYPETSTHEIFVIGDTPNDILCGQSIHAKTIAVATGVYSQAKLVKHSPWWLVKQLPSPTAFEEKLNEENA